MPITAVIDFNSANIFYVIFLVFEVSFLYFSLYVVLALRRDVCAKSVCHLYPYTSLLRTLHPRAGACTVTEPGVS